MGSVCPYYYGMEPIYVEKKNITAAVSLSYIGLPLIHNISLDVVREIV